MRRTTYSYFTILLLSLTSAFSESRTSTVVKMPEKSFAFLDQYCMDCHDADTEKGDFNLEDLSFTLDTIKTAEQWKHVLNSINAGEMPPEDKKQPSSKEKAAFLNILSNVMVDARKALSDSGGDITMRRLNRREYVESIKSLLDIEIDASDLPDDKSSHGFDTTGKSLFFSSDQFEQYLDLGRSVIQKVLAQPQKEPT